MKLRKFISGVAACAVVFGGFAGLSVLYTTAEAYDSYGTGEVVFGTNNGDGTVSDETFTGYTTPTNGSNGWSGSFGNVSIVTDQSKTLSGYVYGTATQEQTRITTIDGSALQWGKTGIPVKSFESAVTHGTVRFNASYYQGTHKKAIELIDSSGEDIIWFGFDGDSNSSTSYNILKIGSNTHSGTINTTRNKSMRLYNVEIDLDKGKITYDIAYSDRKTVQGLSGTKDVVQTLTSQTATFDNADVKSIKFNNYGSNYAQALVDNISLYAIMPATRHAVTVTVTDANGSAIEGASVSVDGYRSVTTDSNGDATLYIDEDDLSKDVEVSADGYDDNTGSITEDNGDYAAAITMNRTAVKSITVNYNNAGNVIKALLPKTDGLYVGDSYTYKSTNYLLGTDGYYYYVAADESADTSYSSSGSGAGHYGLISQGTYTANTVINYDVTRVTDDVLYYAEGEDIGSLSSSEKTVGRYIFSGGRSGANVVVGNSVSPAQLYTIPRTGTYTITLATAGERYGWKLYKTAADAAAGGDNYIDTNTSDLNLEYGYINVCTDNFTKGDVLTIKGTGTNGRFNNIDYIMIKDITTRVAVTVNVTDDSTGAAVTGADVDIAGYTAVETETPGTYTVDLPVGTHDATASKFGYKTDISEVTVSAEEPTLSITMEQIPAVAEVSVPANAKSTKTFVASGTLASSVEKQTIDGYNTYGDGYTYYMTFDFYLTEDGKVSYSAETIGGGVSTSMDLAVTGMKYQAGPSATNITGTLEKNTWYRCTVSSDLQHVLGLTTATYTEGNRYLNNLELLITDTNGTTVVNTTGIGLRNSTDTSNLNRGGLQKIGFSTANNAVVTNVKTYFVPDTNVITCNSSNITAAASADCGEPVTFSLNSGYNISGSPVVTKTGDSSTPVSYSGSGTYTFTMPAYPVTINAVTYTTPDEILGKYTTTEAEAIARGNIYNPKTSATVGDGEYARGFTFEVNSGGIAVTSVAVTATGARNSAYGDAAAASSATATASSGSITGTVLFGIVIHAGSRETAATTEQQNAIHSFDPATGFTIEIN